MIFIDKLILSALLNRERGNDANQGFTLVELMVVIMIVGILSSVALPNFLGQSAKAKVTEAQSRISAALKAAGSEYYSSSTFVGMTAATLGLTNTTDFTYVCTPNAAVSIKCVGTGRKAAVNLSAAGTLNAATGEINYDLDTDPRNLPPNESIAFGSDSGLSCREVRPYSAQLSNGSVYMAGRDSQRNVVVQPVTLKVGSQSWEVKNVVIPEIKAVPYYLETGGADIKWLDLWAIEAAAVINNSDGKFSAEVDASTPGSLKIYSPKGTLVDNVEMEVDLTVDGKGVNQIGAGINRFAYPTFSKKWGKGHFSSTEGQEKIKTTTICDGK